MKLLRDETMRKASLIALALAIIVAVISISTGAGSDIDKMLRTNRYATIKQDPSGRVGLITIDNKSIEEIGQYPWNRSVHADLIKKLQNSGIERLAFDVAFVSDAANQIDDIHLAAAIANAKFPVGLAAPTLDDGGNTTRKDMQGRYPNPRFIKAGAEPVSIWMEMNKNGIVEEMTLGNYLDNRLYPSLSGWAANITPTNDMVPINWSIDDNRLPHYSFVDILKNGATPEMKGMVLIVGADSSTLGDTYPIITGKLVGGMRIQAVAAESILSGQPPAVPVPVVVLIVMIIAFGITKIKNITGHYAGYVGLLLLLPLAQREIERQGIANVPVGAAVTTMAFLIGATAIIQLIRHFYGRMTQNEGTGIPNLLAMKMAYHDPGVTLAITVNNHVDIVSELGGEGRDKIMAKVAQRLEMGSNGRTIYQIDASTFAWRGTKDVEQEITQIKSLLLLLKAGVGFGNGTIDIYATAGIEKNHALSVERGVTNATIAATRANERGIAWETYEEDDTNEHWKISVVSEIDAAIEQNDLWVAYQPKVDSKDGSVIGAEALVRWKHPTRGDVRPDAFIPLLEKANRTDDLTRFMLDKAMEDFSRLKGRTVAVNVSPLMIGTGVLLEMVKDSIKKHDFDPACLTIEVTESERFTRPESIRELDDIKLLGVKISIDDYGMGNSTVNYLKVLPADELKIDRSFISNMLTSHSDKIVVGSTIRLAHEMGLKVVAEGVESADIQACLKEMGCDFIQGYHTGRPVDIESYIEFIGMTNKDWKSVA